MGNENELPYIKKGKIGQFFCRHKETNWFTKQEPFLTLSGDRQYRVCMHCSKQLDERFIRHD